MIRLFVFSQKGLLFLFQDCLDVAIVWNLKLILFYYLDHIPSILALYHFWWSVPVFSMVYWWRTPVVVSSETPIHLVEILFHLSISPPSRRWLMMSAHSWNQHFLWSWVQGHYQPWGTSPLPTTLVSSLGYFSESSGSWIQCSPLCWSQVYLTSWCWKTHSQWWGILAPPLPWFLETPMQFDLWPYNKLIDLFVFLISIPSSVPLVICACYLPVILSLWYSNPFFLFLTFLTCIVVIISFNTVITAMSDRSTATAISF